MSGNNPNLNYALNVLGNATVTGILDAGTVSIDMVETENLETQTLTVAGISTATTPVVSVSSASTSPTNVAKFLAPAASTASIIIGQSTANDAHVFVEGASGRLRMGVGGTTGYLQVENDKIKGNVEGTSGNTVEFLMPALTGDTYLVLGKEASLDNSVALGYSETTTSGFLGVTGNSLALTFDNNGDVGIARNASMRKATVQGLTTTSDSALVVTSSSTVPTTIASLLAPAAATNQIIIGQTTSNQAHVFIEGSSNRLRMGVGGTTGYIQVENNQFTVNTEGTSGNLAELFMPALTGDSYLLLGKGSDPNDSLAIGFSKTLNNGFLTITGSTASLIFNAAGNVAIRGNVTALRNCYTYQASATTAITASIPTVMLSWQVNAGASNTGEALTYTNGNGRFTNNLGRAVVALVTFSGRTDVQVGTLDGYLQFSTLSGPASLQTVQLGDYITLSASLSMAAGAYFTVEGIASVNATWQSTNSIITVTLL